MLFVVLLVARPGGELSCVHVYAVNVLDNLTQTPSSLVGRLTSNRMGTSLLNSLL